MKPGPSLCAPAGWKIRPSRKLLGCVWMRGVDRSRAGPWGMRNMGRVFWGRTRREEGGEMKERLRGGLFPAVPVPRREDGSLDGAAQDAYARWMAAQPVAGAAVWVHTGRGLLIPPAMRREVLRSWREALGPERLLIAGAGAPVTEAQYDRHAVRMAEEAAAGGADALLCFPLVRAAVEGDGARLVALTRAVDAFARVTFRAPMEGYIRRMLWALADTGVIPATATEDPDGPPLAPSERAEVRRATLALAATEG